MDSTPEVLADIVPASAAQQLRSAKLTSLCSSITSHLLVKSVMNQCERNRRRWGNSFPFAGQKPPNAVSERPSAANSYENVPLEFFPTLPPGSAQRDYDMQASARRAHSAKVFHLRKRSCAPNIHDEALNHEDTSRSVVKSRHDLSSVHSAALQSTATAIVKECTKRSESSAASWDPSPVSYLFGGNSDPFDSLGFKITPQLNRAICFAGDYYLASIFVPHCLRPLQADRLLNRCEIRMLSIRSDLVRLEKSAQDTRKCISGSALRLKAERWLRYSRFFIC